MLVKGFEMAVAIGTASNNMAVVAASRSCTLQMQTETIEIAPQEAGFRDYLTGQTDWSIQVSGLFVLGTSKTITELMADGTKIWVQFKAQPNGATSIERYTGRAYITSISQEGSIDGLATYSASIQGSGKLTISTINVQPADEEHDGGDL